MHRFTWPVVLLIVFASYTLHAGEERFLYKGVEQTVKTRFGVPLTIGDTSNFIMNNLRPVIVQNPKSGVCNKTWEIIFLAFEPGLYFGELTSKEAPGLNQTFYADFKNITYPEIGYKQTLYIGDQRTTPLLWEWLNNKETSWIPFRLKFTKLDKDTRLPIEPKKHYEINQWVKLNPNDAETLKKNELDLMSKWKAKRTIYELQFSDGQHFRIPLVDGLPELIDHEKVEIESIQPVIGSTNNNTPRTGAWLAMVRWKDEKQSVSLEITNLKGKSKCQTRLAKKTFGKIYFGLQAESPDFWAWKDEPGDSWLPFRFHLIPESGEEIQFIQWVKISEQAKHEWNKLN